MGLDWFAFVVSFKGVFLEGLEVVFIVLTFGVSAGNVPLAAAGAAVAGAIVLAIGALVHRPLSRVPENTIKYGVGILLSTFGTFWAIEGLGVFSADAGEPRVAGRRPGPARSAARLDRRLARPRRQPAPACAGGRHSLMGGGLMRFSSASAGSGTSSSSATTGGSPPGSRWCWRSARWSWPPGWAGRGCRRPSRSGSRSSSPLPLIVGSRPSTTGGGAVPATANRPPRADQDSLA